MLQRLKQPLRPAAAAAVTDREKPLAEAVDADFAGAGRDLSNGKPRAGKSDASSIRKFVETISALVRRGMGAEGAPRTRRRAVLSAAAVRCESSMRAAVAAT